MRKTGEIDISDFTAHDQVHHLAVLAVTRGARLKYRSAVYSLPWVVVMALNAVAAFLLLSVVNLYHHLTPRTRIL